ncbi:Luciferase-like protein [Macrophomina phaseolina MS6]|uniref:Luciferase-like protein n=1 Tax=Macrophomina phaseolina (strain MS6) TaxID=1126212 RepID=K2RRP4_MACPH|nr:Luciferase-like protein [Macrophomina phaseolina MS6]
MGLPDIKDHAQRYATADEYTHVTYKLWESSWDPGAVVKDTGADGKASFTYTDPAKVHKIRHKGGRFSCEGPHLVEPSPQRVLVIPQAGASGPGIAFAGKHAEVVFTISGTPENAKSKYDAIKVAAAEEGRCQEDLHFVEGITIVVR